VSSKLTSYTEQPTLDSGLPQNDPLIVFFGIGIVINVVMITAYFIWAYKQWKKSDRQKEKKS
jgi:heme/copper-type cytochrome/quinol oxidase subunit 2